ncbi:hypothetical protein OSB04_030790 [Centaurea solstitialis]|uniref:Uncharacterized protein n=1 Tax=Centaurea solstitialis TaxID=347529 RepID=A0AA38VTN6_9ASTR|nr:hypothetical protein OSB04_030790 [Centaurea solstitialis]
MAANIGSNRSPSPLSSRNCRNSEMNSATRRSFNSNPFARPAALTNPRSLNPPTPANSPATIDPLNRHSIGRRSVGNSMFQDGKENHKDTIIRSPAKGGSKNFMAPTISAASKFTPSPRKKVLGEKNDVLRTSIQFTGKDFDLKPQEIDNGSLDSVNLEQKEVVVLETPPPVLEVTLNQVNDATETLSDVTENPDFVNIVDLCPKTRPFCCSPQTSPIIAPIDHPSLPPYDPKKNFLSPRPQFLRYKPNPRIEILLNKSGGNGDYGENDVTKLEDSFNLSENSSDAEEEHEPEQVEKEAELEDSVLGSSEDLSETVSEEKQSDSVVKKASKPAVFRRSKTIFFLSLMFLIGCFSFSFTDSPPMDLPIYKDLSFQEIYHESLEFAASAKGSFDEVVENVKQWSINFLSNLKSHSIFTPKITSIQFFNLTTPPLQEEHFMFNSHIQEFVEEIQDFEEIQEFEEEIQDFVEEMVDGEGFEEMEVDDNDIDVPEEVAVQEQKEVKFQPEEQIQIDSDDLVQKSLNLEDGSSELASTPLTNSETKPDMAIDDLEVVDSSFADSITQSEDSLTSFSTISTNTICLAAISTVILAVSAVFYTIRKKTNATTTAIREADSRRESCSSEVSSIQKGNNKRAKKSSASKRESLASSSSDFSMGSASYGSFTTFERIPIKNGDEVMVTPIRRSSRLMKNQAT